MIHRAMAGWLGKVEEKIWHQGIGDLGFPDSEKLIAPQTEMEKRADAANASVLFFSLAVLICWLYTRKLAKKELCYI